MAVGAVVLAALVVAGFGVAGSAPWHSGPAEPTEPTDGPALTAVARSTPRSTPQPTLEVLRRWDRRRAEAYAAGDRDALRRLYLPGSRAGAADLAVLEAYARRGLRVQGMRMQVLEMLVLVETPTAVRVRVTERLTGAVAVDRLGGRTALPRDEASTREVELRRSRPEGAWRVAEVRE